MVRSLPLSPHQVRERIRPREDAHHECPAPGAQESSSRQRLSTRTSPRQFSAESHQPAAEKGEVEPFPGGDRRTLFHHPFHPAGECSGEKSAKKDADHLKDQPVFEWTGRPVAYVLGIKRIPGCMFGSYGCDTGTYQRGESTGGPK